MAGSALEDRAVPRPRAEPREVSARPRSPDGRASLRESAKATRLLLLGHIVGKTLRFVLDVTVGRVLGPAGFGIVAASMSLTQILNEIGLMGMHQAVLRFASVDETAGRRDADAVTRKGLATVVAATTILCAAVVIARRPLTRIFFGPEVSPWILPACAAVLPAMASYTVLQFRARATRYFVADMLIGSIARSGLPLVVTLLLFVAGWRLWGATAGFSLGMVGTCALAVALVARRRGKPAAASAPARPAAATTGIRDLIRVAAPLALSSASLLLVSELDKVMLAIFRPESEVGIYNASFRIARQVILILPALNGAISPWVAPLLAKGSVEELGRLYRQTTRWALAAGWTAALLFTVFATDFLGLLGPAYLAGASLLVLLAGGQMVISSAGSAGIVLQFSGNERKELGNGLLVMVLNGALNLALIPWFGAMGAAVATVVSLAVIAIRRLLQVRAILGIFPHDRRTLGLAATALVGAGVGWSLRAAAGLVGGGSGLALAAGILGMAVTWALFFRVIGITEEEAALLRIPKGWARRTGA